MKTTLHTNWTVEDLCRGFIFDKNENKGLFGLDGKLIIQPEYQRNYIYGDGKEMWPWWNPFSRDILWD